MNQTEKILQYMKDNGGITQREAIWLGCYRLSARIHDLKASGHLIETEMKKVENADGTSSVVANYRLVGK